MATLSKDDIINVVFGVFMILLAVITIVQAARTSSLSAANANIHHGHGGTFLPDKSPSQNANALFRRRRDGHPVARDKCKRPHQL